MQLKNVSIYKFLLVVLMSFLISFSLLAQKSDDVKHAEVDFSISCMTCHEEETPEITEEWQGSKHGMMNFGCYLCHGDGQEEFYPKPGTERCNGCHSGQEVDFSKVPANNCFDCHQGHTLKFHK